MIRTPTAEEIGRFRENLLTAAISSPSPLRPEAAKAVNKISDNESSPLRPEAAKAVDKISDNKSSPLRPEEAKVVDEISNNESSPFIPETAAADSSDSEHETEYNTGAWSKVEISRLQEAYRQ